MIPPPPPGLRVIVCGGRAYANRERVFTTLDTIHATHPIRLVIHGGADGADHLGGIWAKAKGILLRVICADWTAYGRSAGPIRNQVMADAGADLCVAFPGGRGTADMVKRATAAGIPVQVVV